MNFFSSKPSKKDFFNNIKVDNNSDKKSLTPAIKTADLPEKTHTEIHQFIMMNPDAFTHSCLRDMITTLQIEDGTKRGMFQNLSEEEVNMYHRYLCKQYSLVAGEFINNLPEDDPTSVKKLKDFGPYEVGLHKPDERFMRKALKMFGVAAKQVTTAEDINKMFAEYNDSFYFPYVDVEGKDFKEPWIQTLLRFSAKIAKTDIAVHLKQVVSEKTKVEDVTRVYDSMIQINEIANRSILSTEVRDEFLSKFQPVLKKQCDYFLKFAHIRKVAFYLCQALDIKNDLYGEPEEEVKEPAETTAAEEVMVEIPATTPAKEEVKDHISEKAEKLKETKLAEANIIMTDKKNELTNKVHENGAG